MSEDIGLNENCEMSQSVASPEHMLQSAEQYIQKLKCELKEKEYSLQHMCTRANFFEQIVKNLTTFK